jgi:hypothetical protein
VVCFDERPCFLIGDRLDPIALFTTGHFFERLSHGML